MKHNFKHKLLDIASHKKVVIFEYEDVKLIVAIHNSKLGPALGGLRIRNYATEQEAINDALLLSKGMSYKNAVAGLNLGGGKATLIGDVKTIKTEKTLQLCGEFVDFFCGGYITAPDMNTDIFDMVHIKKTTDHVVCLPEKFGGVGDPSYLTAYGVYMSIKAGVQYNTGKDSLENIRIGVEGVGKVGRFLVDFLMKENASVFIHDINRDAISTVKSAHPEVQFDPVVAFADIDVYAPCALGGILNACAIGKIKAGIIAGAANNQLADETSDASLLLSGKKSYVPDFVANAGGVILAAQEIGGNFNFDKAKKKVEDIYNVCLNLLKQSAHENLTTVAVANRLAESRFL